VDGQKSQHKFISVMDIKTMVFLIIFLIDSKFNSFHDGNFLQAIKATAKKSYIGQIDVNFSLNHW